jgi:transcriptional/translational regulatory protein YebC/TACO1
MAFLEELDDHDDVQSVSSNINLSDEVAAAL